VRRITALTAAGILGLAAAGYALWSRGGGDDGGAWVTGRVDRGAIAAVVLATGTVNPVTTVQVGTYVSGPITEILADFNSPVARGQRVAKIDPAPFEVKVRRAEANLANARAQLAKARADLEFKRLNFDRIEELRRRELVAQTDLDTALSERDQARAQVGVAEAAVQQAEAELAEARINLGYTDIVSPVDGVVVSRSVDVGQTVAASFQTPTLFEIAQDLTKMQVSASVSESDIGAVREGQAAVFTVDAFPEREFSGRVVQVRNAPVVVLNVVTYDVIIEVDNSALELRPGMTATVSITTAQRDDVLRLPIRALRFHPTGKAAAPADGRTPGAGVWRLLPDGGMERIDIELGLRDDLHVELRGDALEEGDAVILSARRPAEPRPAAPSIPGFPARRR
jgi:HlyD family secretion protein